MINRVCGNCVHYDVCLLHEDNFIDDVAKNGFCGKFKNKADFVEVRCQDCNYWIYYSDEKRCHCDLHHINTKRDDFCSYGERK